MGEMGLFLNSGTRLFGGGGWGGRAGGSWVQSLPHGQDGNRATTCFMPQTGVRTEPDWSWRVSGGGVRERLLGLVAVSDWAGWVVRHCRGAEVLG